MWHLSRDTRFPTMWYVRPAKSQTSLRIGADWSEPLLVTWIFYECWATVWTLFGVSKLKRRLHKLLWVYTCQNATLLEITSRLIFTSVDSNEPPFKLRNSKWCSVSSLTVIEYSIDWQRLWSDCASVQADLTLCWLHIPPYWKSHVAAHITGLPGPISFRTN